MNANELLLRRYFTCPICGTKHMPLIIFMGSPAPLMPYNQVICDRCMVPADRSPAA